MLSEERSRYTRTGAEIYGRDIRPGYNSREIRREHPRPPGSADAMYWLGRLSFMEGEESEAERLLAEASLHQLTCAFQFSCYRCCSSASYAMSCLT